MRALLKQAIPSFYPHPLEIREFWIRYLHVWEVLPTFANKRLKNRLTVHALYHTLQTIVTLHTNHPKLSYAYI